VRDSPLNSEHSVVEFVAAIWTKDLVMVRLPVSADKRMIHDTHVEHC